MFCNFDKLYSENRMKEKKRTGNANVNSLVLIFLPGEIE